MLIEFTVGNFKSFKDPVTLNMLASTLSEHGGSHVLELSKYSILKSSILYGANASGKSNLFNALKFMKNFVFSSFTDNQEKNYINVDAFRLDSESVNEPSLFEIIFLVGNTRYRYGFQANRKRVLSEWLYFVPTTKEAKLFERINDEISIGRNFKEGKGLNDKTRKNALFLSVVAQFNGEHSQNIQQWFRKLNIISGIDDDRYMGYTIKKLEDKNFRNWTLKYLAKAGIDIVDFEIINQNINVDDLPDEIIKQLPKKDNNQVLVGQSLYTFHNKYNADGRKVGTEKFIIDMNESQGTQKILALAGPIWDTLVNGKILFIDELDARLHELLTLSLIELFNTNNFNAQFFYATHDTSLLKNSLFRRDQIWFLDKNRYGVTDLYSLADYKESNKTVRKDSSYNKNYMMGRYGAIPIVSDFSDLFED